MADLEAVVESKADDQWPELEELKALTKAVSDERRLEECPICLDTTPDLYKWEPLNIWDHGNPAYLRHAKYLCAHCGKSCCRKCLEDCKTRLTGGLLKCAFCRQEYLLNFTELMKLCMSKAKEGNVVLCWPALLHL
jgi:hypothetical protein